MISDRTLKIVMCVSWLRKVLLCLLIFSCLTTLNVFSQDELSILSGWKKFNNADNALYNEIAGEAYEYLETREKSLEKITTTEQYNAYVSAVREKLSAAFGPLPDKTPLNARITGSFLHEGLFVEKIIFESRPGFWVTGCIFKSQDSHGHLPAVLYVCGHTADGFRSAAYQHVIINLALKGFLVFAIDPIGQGERYQYVNEQDGSSLIGGPTKEHSYAGLQYLLLGRTMAMVRLWDCIRAVDYLTERPDVDASRIGVHGRSGGGTMSSYLGAMDRRIAAAAPECYITSFRRLLESIGPQDAEQNLLNQISGGLDHGDFLIARDNAPTLVVATTQDFFSIQGVNETVQGIQSHPVMGKIMNLSMTFDDAPHQSTKKNRETVYAFFAKSFGVNISETDEEVTPSDSKMLQVTETGQTATSGSKTIYDLIQEDARDLISELERKRSGDMNYSRRIREAAHDLSGYKHFKDAGKTIFCGRIQREGYSIEKYIIGADNGIPLPALFFVPKENKRQYVMLYINPEGKAADSVPGGLIEKLVMEGYNVLSLDIPGYGELKEDDQAGDSVFDGVSYNILFGAQLIGRSLTGIQASYISKACRFIESHTGASNVHIAGIAKGVAGPALLHAAVMEKNITAVALAESPISWVPVVTTRFYDNRIGSTIVPSALTSYDLLDLLCVMSPHKLLVYKPVGGDADLLEDDISTKISSTVASFFATQKENFMMVRKNDQRTFEKTILEWLQ
ncbi:MAG: acetylxylan esterase [Candidatus Latescibacteria bacterium]|nr:acetylxylan esterase [Candidatus Latescibacterota bacterium]